MRSQADVLMGFCHNGSSSSVFMNSVLGAFSSDARRPQRRLVEYHDAAGPYIHDNRARIARYFLEHTDYQWLWMLDNDIEFHADTLYHLLDVAESHEEVKLLGAAYWNQYSGNRYLSWLLFTPEGIHAVEDLPQTMEPVEVTAVGMGCTLIHRDVLQAVADQHLRDPWDTFAADILIRFEDGGQFVVRSPEDFDWEAAEKAGRVVASLERMGEDVTFCLRARRAGYATFGLPTLVVEHFKPHFLEHGCTTKSPMERQLAEAAR